MSDDNVVADVNPAPNAVEMAFMAAADMETEFYTRTEIADAFETVADELRPATKQ